MCVRPGLVPLAWELVEVERVTKRRLLDGVQADANNGGRQEGEERTGKVLSGLARSREGLSMLQRVDRRSASHPRTHSLCAALLTSVMGPPGVVVAVDERERGMASAIQALGSVRL